MAIEVTSSDIFTPEQLQYHAKVYAGPGAGKTHFLVENVKNIITSNPLITQSRMRKVLCVTYTNAAVEEIKRRLGRYINHVEVYTIHGFIIENIIKPFQQELRNVMKSDFGITVSGTGQISSQVKGLGILHGISEDEIYDFVREVTSEQMEMEYRKKEMGDIEVDCNAFVESVLNGMPRQMKFRASSEINEQHVKPIKKYIWSVAKKLTLNEILYFGYRILENNPTALYSIRVKFPFIFVDEFQDTNPLQTLLIKLIGQKSTTVGIVGDVAQSIYSFQGARPTDFRNFTMDGGREIREYVINGNRRSTENIVNFCNLLRQSDEAIVQISQRLYHSEDEKKQSENKKIHFLVGKSPEVDNIIQNTMKAGGVVITRAWAAAFEYIEGIEPQQVKHLKDIYNYYYNSPIQIRDEIAEYGNVTWVRAFRFIFGLWESNNSGSFIDAVQALKLYVNNIDIRKFSPLIIFQLSKLSRQVFSDVENQSITCAIIQKFNEEIRKADYYELRENLLGIEFSIVVFSELDSPRLVNAVSELFWSTSYKLFTEVFSKNSKYMTVHQAKGLEWNKVIVSVNPGRNDSISISNLYAKPSLINESSADEFTRMYYVACSRAKEDLYIHLPEAKIISILKESINAFVGKSGKKIEYEIIK